MDAVEDLDVRLDGLALQVVEALQGAPDPEGRHGHRDQLSGGVVHEPLEGAPPGEELGVCVVGRAVSGLAAGSTVRAPEVELEPPDPEGPELVAGFTAPSALAVVLIVLTSGAAGEPAGVVVPLGVPVFAGVMTLAGGVATLAGVEGPVDVVAEVDGATVAPVARPLLVGGVVDRAGALRATARGFAGVDFAGVDFAGVDFAGVDFAAVDFAAVDFAGVDFAADDVRAVDVVPEAFPAEGFPAAVPFDADVLGVALAAPVRLAAVAAFLAVAFLAVAFLAAGFLAAGFLAAGFLAAGSLAAGFVVASDPRFDVARPVAAWVAFLLAFLIELVAADVAEVAAPPAAAAAFSAELLLPDPLLASRLPEPFREALPRDRTAEPTVRSCRSRSRMRSLSWATSSAGTRPTRARVRSTSKVTRATTASRFWRDWANRSSAKPVTCSAVASPWLTSALAALRARLRVTSVTPPARAR